MGTIRNISLNWGFVIHPEELAPHPTQPTLVVHHSQPPSADPGRNTRKRKRLDKKKKHISLNAKSNKWIIVVGSNKMTLIFLLLTFSLSF